MIPRTLHHIWFGPRPVPEEWVAAWRAMHPGWEHRLWREADVAALPLRNREQFNALLARRSWHGAADIARVEILLAVGGVYVDIDSKPLRSFDGAPFMEASLFAAYEPTPSMPGRIANGTLGAVPDHHVLRQYARAIGEMQVTEPPWDTIGGTALTAILALHRHCECQPLVLPARTFYATDAHGRQTPGKEQPYSEHFWATTNRGYTGRVVVLVPRRAGDPVRDATWQWVRQWWTEQSGWDIFEGHHDDGLFNASKARNEAARLAGDWDVAVFLDADTIPGDIADVQKAVALAATTNQFVRPFRRYVNLDEPVSQAVMETGQLPAVPARAAQWQDGVKLFELPAHGGIVVVPRKLWETVGGYDERFAGWGSEDTAFELACTALAGQKVLDGSVFHLWHPMQDRDTSAPQYQANVALRRRYEKARRPAAMRMLLAERGAEPRVPTFGLLVITNGRKDTIARTIPSLEQNVGPLSARLIVDDSGAPGYAEWLRSEFPAYTVSAHRHMGHGPAIREALRQAARLPVDFVFVCEDDYEFQRPVDLNAIASEMDATPGLVQMVIRRQAWFQAEIDAGGMIERFDPAMFTEHAQNGTSWIEHRVFYSLNPHLVRRSFLARLHWPAIPNSEHLVSRRLFRDPRLRAGIWGTKADEPWALHFGERTGSGY